MNNAVKINSGSPLTSAAPGSALYNAITVLPSCLVRSLSRPVATIRAHRCKKLARTLLAKKVGVQTLRSESDSLTPTLDEQAKRHADFFFKGAMVEIARPQTICGHSISQTVKRLKAPNCYNAPCYGHAMLRFDSVL